MAKVVITPIGPGYTSTSKLNENFEAIEQAIENTLSRDGTTPNHMESDLDLNSYRVINVGDPILPSDAVNLRTLRYELREYITDSSMTLNDEDHHNSIILCVNQTPITISLADMDTDGVYVSVVQLGEGQVTFEDAGEDLLVAAPFVPSTRDVYSLITATRTSMGWIVTGDLYDSYG